MKPNVSVQAIIDNQDTDYERGFWEGYNHPAAPLSDLHYKRPVDWLSYDRGRWFGRETALVLAMPVGPIYSGAES